MGVDPFLIERWLAARDHVSMRETWSALPSTLHQLGKPHRKLTLHGASLLAHAMTGTRADWLVDHSLGPNSTFHVNRISDGSFLDHVWSVHEANNEGLAIEERRDGLRGVQLISISSGTITGRPEGGGVSAVRVFDRDRAVSIPIDTYDTISKVAMIGDVDLAPLDLFNLSRSFVLATTERDFPAVRGVAAQLAAEVDAHYDTSPSWPEGPKVAIPGWDPPQFVAQKTFVEGPRAIAIGIDTHDRRWVQVLGLEWGQQLGFTLEPTHGDHDRAVGYLIMRFSTADLDRIEARLSAIGDLR